MNTASLADLIALMEEIAPPALCEDWDNVGLMVGRRDSKIAKILVALDVTAEVVEQALALGADLIITHHPAIFKKLASMTDADWQQELLLRLVEHKIAVYSAHTNLDCAPGGVNTVLAEVLKLKDVAVLDDASGLGRIGTVKPFTLKIFAQYVKALLHADYVAYADAGKKVQRVAICGGAGSDLINLALAKGADTLVTGDVKYHEAQRAAFSGLNIIDAGHQPTEWPVLQRVAQMLGAKCAEKQYNIEIKVAKETLLLQHV